MIKKEKKILLVLVAFGVVIFAILVYKRKKKNEMYQMEYPQEIPGHRPSTGDFLPTVGTQNLTEQDGPNSYEVMGDYPNEQYGGLITNHPTSYYDQGGWITKSTTPLMENSIIQQGGVGECKSCM